MTYFSRMSESVSSAVAVDVKTEYSLRVLQVAEVLGGDDSESYAQYLIRALKTIEGEDTGGKVIQEVVEYALTYVRTGTFPGIIRDTSLSTTHSFILGPWRGHRATDNSYRRERSHGSNFPPNHCCVSMRV